MFDTSTGLQLYSNKHIILLYDGLSTDRNTADDEAKLLRRKTKLTAVGTFIGKFVGYSELVNITSDEDHAFTYHHKDGVYNRLLRDTADYGRTGKGVNSKIDISLVPWQFTVN